MLDLTHDDLLKSPNEPYEPAPSPSHSGLWIVVTILVAAAAGTAAYFVYGRQPVAAPVPPSPAHAELSQPAAQPLGGAAEPIVLPPLDQSDALVREMVKGIASHPRIAAWLAGKDLIRNFTVVVASVAEGKSPAKQLPMLRPSASFSVIESNNGLEIDPSSYARYNGIAAAAAAIDPLAAARLYATLKPRIEDAYRDLGYPNTPFDQTLQRAIVSLLEVPTLADPVLVVPDSTGIGYRYASPRIQALTDAQKELLRTGPRNTQAIQGSLRAIAIALGIKLPSA